jgi:hypothetical protein
VTVYKLNRFTLIDALRMIGKIADITEWGNDELETKITYPAARVLGTIDHIGPYLNIATTGAVVTDASTGAQLGTRPAEPGWNVGFTWVCEVANVRDP